MSTTCASPRSTSAGRDASTWKPRSWAPSNARRPERRFSDPGFSFQNHGSQLSIGAVKEGVEVGQLVISGHDVARRHFTNIVTERTRSSRTDEITLLIVPVVSARARWLFPDTGPDIALDLVDSRADSKGVTIQVYRPNGRPQYATASADHDDE